MAYPNRDVVSYKYEAHGFTRAPKEDTNPQTQKYLLIQETKEGDVTVGIIHTYELVKQIVELLNERIEPSISKV